MHVYRVAPSGPTPAIRRLRERRFADASQAVAALRSGEITLVEHVPPEQVPALSQVADLKVGRYARPRVHLLALDGRTPALRNRNLRRGLAYAIDRKGLLEEVILHRAGDEANAPADGVFPRGNYADAPGVAPLSFDPALARMLVAAGRRELGGGAIKLSLAYPPLPEARAAVPKIAEALRAAGIELDLAERPETELEMDLRSGKRFDLAYRALSCREPIADAGPLICPGYDAPPSADALAAVVSPRILQLLLLLENASDFPTARGLVLQIDREVRDELPVIPLWQVAAHFAWHTRLKGPGETAEALYDGIERWQIEAWYARDPW
jgi:peptide/nickel transport system substrate-binding protein